MLLSQLEIWRNIFFVMWVGWHQLWVALSVSNIIFSTFHLKKNWILYLRIHNIFTIELIFIYAHIIYDIRTYFWQVLDSQTNINSRIRHNIYLKFEVLNGNIFNIWRNEIIKLLLFILWVHQDKQWDQITSVYFQMTCSPSHWSHVPEITRKHLELLWFHESTSVTLNSSHRMITLLWKHAITDNDAIAHRRFT